MNNMENRSFSSHKGEEMKYLMTAMLLGVYGVSVVVLLLRGAGGGRTLRVAKLRWSTRNIQLLSIALRSCRHCNGGTPGNGIDPPAELR